MMLCTGGEEKSHFPSSSAPLSQCGNSTLENSPTTNAHSNTTDQLGQQNQQPWNTSTSPPAQNNSSSHHLSHPALHHSQMHQASWYSSQARTPASHHHHQQQQQAVAAAFNAATAATDWSAAVHHPVNMLAHPYGSFAASYYGHPSSGHNLAAVSAGVMPYQDMVANRNANTAPTYHYSPYNAIGNGGGFLNSPEHEAELLNSHHSHGLHHGALESSHVLHHGSHHLDVSSPENAGNQLNSSGGNGHSSPGNLSPIDTKPSMLGLSDGNHHGVHLALKSPYSDEEECGGQMMQQTGGLLLAGGRPQIARSPFEWIKKSNYGGSQPAPG